MFIQKHFYRIRLFSLIAWTFNISQWNQLFSSENWVHCVCNC